MIFRIQGFDLEVILEENAIPIVCIENKLMFRKVVETIQSKILGTVTNEVVIEKDQKELMLDKNTVLISNFLDIELSQKSFQSLIYKEIESIINVEYDDKENILRHLNDIGVILEQSTMDFDFHLDFESNVSISSLLKLFNFTLDETTYNNSISKLYTLIDIYSYFSPSKVMLFVNVSSYFDSIELQEIFNYLNYKKVIYMCIESSNYDKMGSEKIYKIDQDLVEYMPYD